MATLAVKKKESIFDELEQVHDRIMKRAFEIFDGKGHRFGKDLDDWLTAEHELVWNPAVELAEKDNEFRICIAAPGIDAKDIDIEVTPEYFLVKAETRHEHQEDKGQVHVCEFESGNLFRSIQFPKTVNPDKVKAEFKNGMLHVTAPIAAETQTRKIELKAS
jgi:HSP20 family molecular chaperone IbpA